MSNPLIIYPYIDKYTAAIVSSPNYKITIDCRENLGDPTTLANKIVVLPEILRLLEYVAGRYIGFMESEFSYPDDPWTPERNNDVDLIKALSIIRKFKQTKSSYQVLADRIEQLGIKERREKKLQAFNVAQRRQIATGHNIDIIIQNIEASLSVLE